MRVSTYAAIRRRKKTMHHVVSVVICLGMMMQSCGDATILHPTETVPSSGQSTPRQLLVQQAEVAINEVFPESSQIELSNPGIDPVNVSGYWVCHTTPALAYASLPDDTIIQPGSVVIVHWGISGTNSATEVFTAPAVQTPLNVAHGEIGLYRPIEASFSNFSNSDMLVDYVQWGQPGHFREGVAVRANLWAEGVFVASPAAGQSLALNRNQQGLAWEITQPTIGIDQTIVLPF